MRFFAEQRRAWIRTRSHTQVLDRDPEFERFSRDASGQVRYLYRIWFAGRDGNRVYLGCLRLCNAARSDLGRLFRRLGARDGYSPREMRARLVCFLRGLTSRESSAG